ncbi:DNA gyrase subunit B [Candidatus Mycoplasma haematolamae str. Purdue]|uniref:DNA topoisomerase (ATP-hydrolyzing) n=1 Tax=Mycoplasma haematolamae (strain Purdue) TaxID=1212765 RepID=I7BIF6_MYCHA|nr:type IIA DNA topoisomerase subunit B [Candidatus Mycoplasma haematolamae]AFO51603.1 DNA gyrase subunit B [Candidatus Mycoplasma haematolamae str. Purdue]
MEEEKLLNEQVNTEVASDYEDKHVQVLRGLEAIRLRPGMYVGSTEAEGLHHLIWEAIDNSVDEAVAGHAKNITLTIEADRIVSVEDDGRGLPTGINDQTGLPTIVVIFTELHAGGKFDNSNYKMSGGLHGVGVKCVNALSTFLEVEVHRDGKRVFTRFIEGGKLERGPESTAAEDPKKTGTKIRWQPDFSVLEDCDYNLEWIKDKLERLSFLNRGISFTLRNQLTGEEAVFKSNKGLQNWVEKLNEGSEGVHDAQTITFSGEKEINKRGKKNLLRLEASFQYVSNREKPIIFSYCNNIHTSLGGVHLEGVKEGMLLCISEYALKQKIIKNVFELKKEDITSGLTLVLSVHYTDPAYKGQTKETLISNEIKPVVKEEIDKWFHFMFQENEECREAILEHIKNEYLKRLNREKNREIERDLRAFSSLEFAEKLADCTIKDPRFSELYIVEGDSAGGSAKSARNREFQAILPIKGKLVNIMKRSEFRTNQEVKNLFTAIGCDGLTDKEFDIEKLRYNKIIIMTDADVDGAHIRVLLLTFFQGRMRKLLENGHVYVAQPPLFKASSKKETVYLFDEAERAAFEREKNRGGAYEISRFKGLGEMSPAQLWETTMDPSKRTFLKVSVKDDEISFSKEQQRFTELMGKKVKFRKDFIRANYSRANIDA